MQSTEPFAVLVVEDEFLVAFDLTAMLEGAAFTVLGPVADAAAALALVAQSQPDAALLDVNLGSGKTSYEIARILAALSIPFMFLSGYDRTQLPEEFQGASVLSKPVVFQSVKDWLHSVQARSLSKSSTVQT
jgi:CheY-like chemotaxis protein